MVEGDDLTQHFIKLAQRYPLEAFEKSMNEFIQMTLSSTEKPALSEVGQKNKGGREKEENTSDRRGLCMNNFFPYCF